MRLLDARLSPSPRRSRAAVLVAAVAVLAPAWLQLGAYDRHDGAAIAAQRRADVTAGAELNRLIEVIQRQGGGRTYAGMPTNWGQGFMVGTVPVFKYLESRDVDEVGYTLRTASLMSGPESYFDDRNPSDYRLFGIRYLILRTGSPPPVPAGLKLRAGPYALWTIGGAGYIQPGRIAREVSANRTNLGERTVTVLRSHLAEDDRYVQVRFDETGSAALSSAPPVATGPAGSLLAQSDHLSAGWAAATVAMRRRGVTILSASFDPGWTVTVDGRSRPARMVAPALVATTVPAGTHRIVFRYHGFGDYPLLFAIGAGGLLTLSLARRTGNTGRE
jgi:hypothetical protein